MTCLLQDKLPFARQIFFHTSCHVSHWFTIRLLPYLTLILSSLSSISWFLRPLPHLNHAPHLFNLFPSYLWSLILNKSWLFQMTPSHPTCLMLSLQSRTRLIAQTYSPEITHNIAQNTLQSSSLIRQTITHNTSLVISSLTQKIFPLQSPSFAAL